MRSACGTVSLLLLSACAADGVLDPPVGAHARSAIPAGIVEIVDAIAARAISEVPIDALSIVVLHGDKTLVARGYGKAGTSADTTYRIGSISKFLTALAVMQLVEEKRLVLEDRLGEYFPDTLPAPDVTIAQLLSHTSGLPTHEQAAVVQWRERAAPITDQFVWDHLRSEPRLAAPGTAWSYASSNFHLLGLLVERITGRSYEAQVKASIASPLGLGSLSLCSGQPPAATQARDYLVDDGRLAPDPNWTLPGIGGAGGWCASARDVARLVHETARAKLVEPETVERMTAPTRTGGVEFGYGLGVRLGLLDGHSKWGHTGGGAIGNRTVVAHYPAEDLTIAVLANTEREDSPMTAMDIEALVARAIIGLAAAGVRTLPLPTAAERYEGIYESGSRHTRIALDAGRLMVSRVGSQDPPEAMQYQGGHEFVPYADSPGYRFIFVMRDDRAYAISTYDAGWFAGARVRGRNTSTRSASAPIAH